MSKKTTSSQNPIEKKAYWKKRMSDKITSAMRSIDWLWDETLATCEHAGVDPKRAKKCLDVIGVGFAELLNAVNEVPPRTKEGVVDLGKIKEQ